jgi:PAS domain S-box-containing protein
MKKKEKIIKAKSPDTAKKRKKAKEKLHHEEELFRAFVEHSSDIIVLLNLEGTIIYINPAVEQVLGFKPEERIGAKGFELVHPDDIKFLTDSFNTLARDTNSPVIHGEMRLRHKDGSWRTLQAVGSNLVHNNVIEAVIINYRDITERKKTEEALRESEARHRKREERYRNILDNMEEAYYEVDLKGNFTFFNATAVTNLGYTDNVMMGMNFRQYVDEENASKVFEAYNKVFLTGESIKGFDWELISKESGKIPIESSISLMRDAQGNPIGFRGIIRDITERKKAEETLKETLESLRKSIATTIQVLGTASEVRDPYTAGHQKRVADLARAIATEMKLPHDKIEGIRMAGSIHDIGKLSIPTEILSKPTKLTTEIEFSMIKEHAQSGYEILKDVDSSWPLAQIVYQHHERMNGSGYPRNLKGDEIILEARIMAVADVVEAMASYRPYRPTLGIEAALEEIEKNKGILYDDTVAEACLRLFREKGYQLK